MLDQPHISPLTQFVHQIRQAEGLDEEVPYFDPFDGGVNARVLFILEAPGAKAVQSGFISRNNPDETAKNMFQLLQEAGFRREETILWNIVPWYIGSGTKIRPANHSDITDGMAYLEKLIQMLGQLKCIVLVGKKAALARGDIEKLTMLPILETYHPSPLFVNNKPGNRNLLLKTFEKVRQQCV